VKGNLYDQNGQTVLTQSAYAGNIFDSSELTKSSRKKILEEMEYKVGKGLINSNIPPGGKVPFMIVFYGIPESLAEFDVELISSEDATKN